MNDTVAQAVAEIRRHWAKTPRVALILGTGLGSLSSQIQQEAAIAFDSIPGFPKATALSHRGRVVCGHLNGVPLMLLDGRCHLYEGYPIDEITRPIRVVHACGAECLIISNASGGLNPRFGSGDVMLIEDHISLLGKYGLMHTGGAPQALQHPHAAPARNLYDPRLIERCLEIARVENFPAHRGVYVAVTGPNYETRAEYRFLRRIGGDAVGMSTIPEAWVAAELGMRTVGMSIITNVACPDAAHTVDAHHVVDAASAAEPRVRKIVTSLLASEWASSPRSVAKSGRLPTQHPFAG